MIVLCNNDVMDYLTLIQDVAPRDIGDDKEFGIEMGPVCFKQINFNQQEPFILA